MKNDKMKRIVFICLLAGIVFAGYAQNRMITQEKDTLYKHKMMRPIITDSFEKFDLDRYIKQGGRFKEVKTIDDDSRRVKIYKRFDFSKHENDTLYSVTGYSVSGSDNYSYTYREIGDSSFFGLVKGYYPNKNKSIRVKFIEFINFRGTKVKIGKEYRFNEDGILTQVIDHDKDYIFLIEDVIAFAQKENIPLDRLRNRDIYNYNSITRTKYNNAPAWEVWCLDSTTQTTYILDGQTGNVLEKTVTEDFFFEE